MNTLARDFIARWEGCRLTAYRDVANVLTIGYGHTGPDVKPGMVISEARALELLESDMAWASEAVDTLVTVPLNEAQHAALTSWVFNVGAGAARTSTLIRKLNAGDYDAVPGELARWNQAGGRVVRGLVNRRADEGRLFASHGPPTPIDTPDEYDAPAPSGGFSFWGWLKGLFR